MLELMETRSLKYVAESCDGEIINGAVDTPLYRVSTDSRRVRAGDLFVALAGENFDGHDYVVESGQNGAAAALVEKGRGRQPATGLPLVVVADTRLALGKLASRYRRDFNLPIVIVGGSNGKTTTKELIASVVRQRFKTLASEASFNNDIGVPLTLLSLEEAHQIGVLEVGTNHPGELAPLVRMIQPQLGVVTTIGREHLEFFGNLAAVAQEEGWLAELLPAKGKLFIGGDGDWCDTVVQRTRASIIRLGTAETNDWRATAIRVDGLGTTFELKSPIPSLNGRYRINLLGRHQAVNALFALAVGAELGLSREELEKGLADCHPPKMRLQLWETNGVQVLDDSYNANADSMNAAIQTLYDFPCAGRRIAVLGDMAELGEFGPDAHAEIGRRAAQLGVDHLFAVGRMAPVVAGAARGAGLAGATEFGDIETAGLAVKEFVRSGDVILLKASRATRLERIGIILRGDEKAAAKQIAKQ